MSILWSKKCSHKKEVVAVEGFIAQQASKRYVWLSWKGLIYHLCLLCECDYVDKNRYIHQLTKIERTKQTNKTLRKGPLKVVNINCYVFQAEMFASLCLPTKHIFAIGYVPRVKGEQKSPIISHLNCRKFMCQSRQAANSFIYLLFSAVI